MYVTSFSFNLIDFLLFPTLPCREKKKKVLQCAYCCFWSADCVKVGQLLVFLMSYDCQWTCTVQLSLKSSDWEKGKLTNFEEGDKVISIWLEIQSWLCSAGYWSRRLVPGHKEQSRQIACCFCLFVCFCFYVTTNYNDPSI